MAQSATGTASPSQGGQWPQCDDERIAESFETPEEIDDSYTTAPSKRILAVEPQYQKVTDGNLAATRIGLDIMREKCPHFNGRLSKLEALGQNYRTGK